MRRSFLLLLAACAAFAADTARLRDQIQEILAKHKVPGASVAVIDGFGVVWAEGFGLRGAGAPDPVTPDTLFQAASISKPVAAAAALRLVEQGKLSLDEDVNAKLRSWRVPSHEFQKPVTLRGIVAHNAGLTVHGFRGYAEGEAVPTLPQLLDGTKPANSAAIRVNVEPGTTWRYSGGGYCVLQQLLLDVTGKQFPALLRELVLDRAGMKRSTYAQPLPKPREKEAALGHRADGKIVAGRWHQYPEMAAAGLWTTPSDLARFFIELQRAMAGKSRRVLSPEMARRMTENRPAITGSAWGCKANSSDTAARTKATVARRSRIARAAKVSW